MGFIITAEYIISCWGWKLFRLLQHKGRSHPCQDIFLSFRGKQDPPVGKKPPLIILNQENIILQRLDNNIMCTYLEMVQQIFRDSEGCTNDHFWHILGKKANNPVSHSLI